MNTLTMRDVRIFYRDDGKTVLEVPDVSMSSGINLIVGQNGAGKSTLLRALTNSHVSVGLEGTLTLNGHALNRRVTALVDQEPAKSISPQLTFKQNMLLAQLSGQEFLSLRNLTSTIETGRLNVFLAFYSLHARVEELMDTPGSSLSVGQQQLLAILMRLMRFKEVLLLDEATANLDRFNASATLNMLNEIASKGTIILFATHHLHLQELSGVTTFSISDGKLTRLLPERPT